MLIEIHNMLSIGLNVGFEYYSKDSEFDFYEIQINLLIIKFVLKWQ